ncbi:MAG: RDD family protein [Actinomycetota bacterium]|nr:RDD family protein [Actinomycetota bacterium]
MAQPAPPPGESRAGPSGPRADFWYRLGGFLIDAVILFLIGQLVGFVFGRNVVAVILIGLALGIGYSVYFIGSGSGQTVGMRVLGIRAIDAATYGRVDYGKAFVRYLVAIVAQIPCYLGYFWMLWDPERQTWHDKAAKTFVVPVSEYPVDAWPG